MIDAVLTELQGDATLAGILTGGIHRTREISRQLTPSVFDGFGEMQPCALVRQESQTPWGPHDDSSRLYITIYLYELIGYTSIEAARREIYELLHRKRLTPASGGCYEIVHANDLLDVEDEALEASMAISRFVATIQR